MLIALPSYKVPPKLTNNLISTARKNAGTTKEKLIAPCTSGRHHDEARAKATRCLVDRDLCLHQRKKDVPKSSTTTLPLSRSKTHRKFLSEAGLIEKIFRSDYAYKLIAAYDLGWKGLAERIGMIQNRKGSAGTNKYMSNFHAEESTQ